jgi:hypothetical protein
LNTLFQFPHKFAGVSRRDHIGVALAQGKARVVSSLDIESSNLVERDTQRQLWHIFVFDVNRRADDANAACLQIGKIICVEDVGALTSLVQIHQQVEVHVHNAMMQAGETSFEIGIHSDSVSFSMCGSDTPTQRAASTNSR